MSILVYVASVIHILDNIINLVQREINRFSEILKIKYTNSCQGFEGGRFSYILKFKLSQYNLFGPKDFLLKMRQTS